MNKIPLIVSIEGNIGIGKSTLLDNLELSYKSNGITDVIILREPVEEWSVVRDENNESILKNFYRDPVKYSFSFQILILKTMVDLLLRTISDNPNCKIIICERSVKSSFNVFVKMQHHSFMMNKIEFQIYESIYKQTLLMENIRQHKIVYLYCRAEICFERIQSRCREGEDDIDLDYLKRCDRYHRLWLNDEDRNTIIKINMESNIEYDLNDKENIGCKWIDQIKDFVH